MLNLGVEPQEVRFTFTLPEALFAGYSRLIHGCRLAISCTGAMQYPWYAGARYRFVNRSGAPGAPQSSSLFTRDEIVLLMET